MVLTRQDIKLAALRCSDQLYSSNWQSNLENLFLTKGEKSNLTISFPLSSTPASLEGQDSARDIISIDSVCKVSIDSGDEAQESLLHANGDGSERPCHSEKAAMLGLAMKMDNTRHDRELGYKNLNQRHSGNSWKLKTVDDVRGLPLVCDKTQFWIITMRNDRTEK